jgi:hypothetical protein
MAKSAGMLVGATLAVLATNCVPGSRFDELSEGAPVVVIPRSEGMTSFGYSLATASRGSEAELAVGGEQFASSVAVYRLGGSDQPTTTATTDGFCGGADCVLAKQFVGRAVAALSNTLPEQTLCYTMGAGETMVGGETTTGLMTRCSTSDKVHPLLVPPAALPVIENLLIPQRQDLVMATSRVDVAPLLVGAKSTPIAWYYHPASYQGVQIPSPSGVTGFGETVAVADGGNNVSILAIGSPVQDTVRLYSAPYVEGQEEQDEPTFIGCVTGGNRFGQTMAVGDVDGDGIDELAISDTESVTIYSGSGLAELSSDDVQDCSATPDVLATLTCGADTGLDLGSCDGADFGKSIAIGDFDGDGDGDVAVGTPGMKVRGFGGAGVVLVYDVDDSAPERLTSTLFLSSGGAGDGLGFSLAAPRIGERHIIAAGAPGGGEGKVALFYCPALSGTNKFARCQ